MTAPTVIHDLTKAVTSSLAELGFKKRADLIFTVEAADDVLGWLGCNRASEHRPAGQVAVNPVIGVRHQGVERIVADCRGEKLHPYHPPTVNTPLGYLFPNARYRVWEFGVRDAEAVAQEMVRAIEEHGLPFIRLTAALPELCRRLDERMGIEEQVAYRRPVAWLLAGDRERAENILHETMAGLRNRSDLAAEEFRRFGAVFRDRLEDAS